jgi:hypothetical protein
MARPYAVALLAALAAPTASGCGKSNDANLPPLHPVRGQLLNKGAPVTEGAVSFHPLNEQAAVIINGKLDNEGRFELTTVRGASRVPGAPAGQYQVIYSPPVLGKNALPVSLPGLTKIDAGTTDLALDMAAKK